MCRTTRNHVANSTENSADFIFVLDEVVPAATCRHIVERFLGQPAAPGRTGTGVFERSALVIGEGQTRKSEFGFEKVEGDDGAFVTTSATGMVLAMLDADSPRRARFGWTSGPDDHNRRIRDYFVACGLPSEQIAYISAHATVGGAAQEGGDPPQMDLASYTTSISRAIDGIPVYESYAWGRLNVDGDLVAEGVYWPAIPAAVAADARALQAALADPDVRASLDAQIGAARSYGVVIHHRVGTSLGEAFAVASYDYDTGGPMAIRRSVDATGAPVVIPRPVSPASAFVQHQSKSR